MPATARPTPEIGVDFATLTPSSPANPPTVVQELIRPPAPTETATPAYVPYRIEAGDTLVAIAADQGLTLDELLALNPDIQPELLMVGQEIALPPRPAAEEAAIRATAGNFELEIAGL